MRITGKHFLIGLFMAGLWAPLLQDTLHIFKGGLLKGYVEQPRDITFDFKYWFDGTYAAKKDSFLRYNFGFRPDIVRVYNQYRLSAFDVSPNDNVVFGKDYYLYAQDYIDAYYGTDFVGDDTIIKTVKALRDLQDTLQHYGITVCAVFAPGKGSYYNEFLPENSKKPITRTNYQAYLQHCKDYGVNYIDFKSYFDSIKPTVPHRLYARCAVHWSYYGEFIAFDSLCKYLRKTTHHYVPEIVVDSVPLSTKPRYDDYEMGSALNLLVDWNYDTLAYPQFTVPDSLVSDLSFLDVGDSYYWTMYSYMMRKVFSNPPFFYYFQQLHYEHDYGQNEKNTPLKPLILQQKVVFILYCDRSLKWFGNGFIQAALKCFQQPDSIGRKQIIYSPS